MVPEKFSANGFPKTFVLHQISLEISEGQFVTVIVELKPYRQKDLLRLVLPEAILGPDYVKIALYGRPPEIGPLAEAQPRSQIWMWLPGLPSQSVLLWDCLTLEMKRVARGQTGVIVLA